ncbi:unnamed protein product [Spirodela intermedia]|uniref:Reverse transcriptase Ty1/copia-type domain-containing protein n=1 Tax=Spirodela intermedia TaxID=51605 RepID=A0A7I8KX61_SPIIN|nr:unnamed protein product [Spirodela intermedia]
MENVRDNSSLSLGDPASTREVNLGPSGPRLLVELTNADGSFLIIAGIGDIKLEPLRVLTNVLHVSKLFTKLISPLTSHSSDDLAVLPQYSLSIALVPNCQFSILSQTFSTLSIISCILRHHYHSKKLFEALSNLEWKHAIDDEMRALAKNQTWDLVELPREKKTVVAKMNIVRFLLSLAAIFSWNIQQFDVKNVFFHSDLVEEVYMTLPPGCEGNHPSNLELKGHILLKAFLFLNRSI